MTVQQFLNSEAVQHSSSGVDVLVYCSQPATSDSNVAVAVEQEGRSLEFKSGIRRMCIDNDEQCAMIHPHRCFNASVLRQTCIMLLDAM